MKGIISQNMNINAERIQNLRSLMADNGWDAVVISGSDPHASEYVASRWQQVAWLSGFTGEAGDLVITMDHAGLWTDSRFFIQAVRQLEGTGVVLHKTRVPGAVSIPEWLAGRASVVAVDGLCQTVASVTELEKAGCTVADVPDLLSALWPDRPGVPSTPVMTLSEESVGQSRYSKLTELRKFLLLNDCDCILVPALDQIAWLLNVRGEDIDYNPYVISYLLVTQSDAFWFAGKGDETPDPDTQDSFQELEADGISILPYGEVKGILEDFFRAEGQRVFLDLSSVNYSLYQDIAESAGEENIVSGTSPVILWKAVKNSSETEGLCEAFLEDGIAMEKFLFWLDTEVGSGRTVSEWDASEKLSSLRAEIPGYRGDSFANISAYGPNAALPHYSTPESGSAVIEPRGLYLTDSGGQYLFGTTDITRTVPVGECSYLEKEDYTLVLKGMIALARAIFPSGTAGCQIDVLARNPLWQNVRNFGHGTGHGVGFYSGVHEGPQDIRQNFNPQPLLPGMVTSDEPGIYREGMHGIRHENILLCRELETNAFGSWLCFETLTLCHIDTSAIIRDLMTADEIEWLNSYNRRVFETLSPRLDDETVAWLRSKTLPV